MPISISISISTSLSISISMSRYIFTSTSISVSMSPCCVFKVVTAINRYSFAILAQAAHVCEPALILFYSPF